MTETIKDSKGNVWEFYVDPLLKKFIDRAVKPRITKRDQDYVLLIDGVEGTGKSTFGLQLARYVDPDFSIDRVCFNAEEFKNAVIKAKKGQCVMFDEAVAGLSSGESIAKIGKMLKSLMMQMRQKNLFVLVVIPSVFELNRYVTLHRARAMLRTYESKGRRGYWVGYNKKDLKNGYLLGKQTYSFKKRSPFKGRFYGKYAVDEEEYRKKKEEALENVNFDYADGNKYLNQRNKVIHLLREEIGNVKEVAEKLNDVGIPIKDRQVYNICADAKRLIGEGR